MPSSTNGSWEALAIVSASIVFALIGGGWTCIVRSWCLRDNTCKAVNGSSAWPAIQCSFTNVVPLVSDLLYHNASDNDNLAGLTRGMCGVGERMHLSSVTGAPTCMLLRPYPDALDTEVMQPGAASYHKQACGKWITGGLSLQPSMIQTPEYLSFDDTVERGAAVRKAEAAMHAGSRLSSTNLGKFRAACQRAVLGGSSALRAAGQLAYTHLIAAANVDAITDETTALRALGMLTGHYCDAPVLFGWELRTAGYRASSRRGTSFTQNTMASALNLVSASFADQSAAEAGNSHVNQYAFDSPAATTAQLWTVYEGGTLRAASAGMTMYTQSYTPELDGFLHLTGANIGYAKAYVKGLAAMCAFSMQNSIDYIGYTASGSNDAASRWLVEQRNHRPAAEALGQLRAPPKHEPLFEVESEAVINASTITLSQLVGAPSGDGDAACRDFTRALFPDEIDRVHFDLVVSDELYDRMQATVADMRAGVASVLRNDARIRAALSDPDAIATDVESTHIRIPGAPRGTWAGSSRALPVVEFNSNDGVFVMAAKQARVVWLDRQRELVYDATDPCEGPSSYHPLTANAYIFPSYRCSYYLLGMSFRPYADERYDALSLSARFGYIIAHELAHNNLNTPYTAPGIDTLTTRYTATSTRNEAFADILGSLGVISRGYNRSDVCMHISQAWCARVPPGYYGTSGHSHPLANRRGDYLCQTLVDLDA